MKSIILVALITLYLSILAAKADDFPAPAIPRQPITAFESGGESNFANAPEVGWRTLLELVISANPTHYASDDWAIVLDSLYRMEGDPDCIQAQRALNDPTLRDDFLASLRQARDAFVGKLARSSHVATLKFSSILPFSSGLYGDRSTYNRNSGSLEWPTLGVPSIITFKAASLGPASRTGCLLESGGLDREQRINFSYPNIDISMEGVSALAQFPVSKREAKFFMDNAGDGYVLEYIASVSATQGGLSGRVLDAHLKDAKTKKVLHQYDRSLFSTSSAGENQASLSSPTSYQPATRAMLTLTALRALPDLINDQQYNEITKSHIELDQFAYKKASHGESTIDNNGKHVFVFAEADVEGRDPDFILPIMVPKMRKALVDLIAAMPRRLSFGASLGGRFQVPSYDHATSTARFQCCTGNKEEFELLPPAQSIQMGINVHGPNVNIDSSSEFSKKMLAWATYGASYVEDGPISSTERVARGYLGNLSSLNIDIALDRILTLNGVSISPSRMELLLTRLKRDNVNGVYSKIYVTVQGVERSPDRRSIVVFAHLDGADILDPDGKILVHLNPTDFPSAPDLAAKTQQQLVAARSAIVQGREGPTITKGPVELDVANVGLLTARSVGDRLSPEALAYLVVQRWALENSKTPPPGLFFALGQRRPSPEEAASLGPKFVSWAKTRLSDGVIRVMVHQQAQLNKGGSLPLARFACFSGLPIGQMGNQNVNMGFNANILECERKRQQATLAPGDGPACVANEAASANLSTYLSAGPSCRSAPDVSLGFANPLTTTFHISQSLPQPKVTILGDSRIVDAAITLDISSLTLSAVPPTPTDGLPDPIRRLLPGFTPDQNEKGEFLTINAAVVDVRYSDPQGGELTRLTPESPTYLDKLIADFRQAQAEEAAPVPTQASIVHGPDLIGLRLGMEFDQAENLIRHHMQVSRVLVGKRASEVASKAGFNQPMDSGKLFVSVDGLELIAILDEPPAAPKHIVAAWRRVYIPQNTLAPEEIFQGITKKYGSQGNRYPSPLHTGAQAAWYKSTNINCEALYNNSKRRFYMEDWVENGNPTTLRSANGLQPYGPAISYYLYDPLNAQNQLVARCGPMVTAYLSDGQEFGGAFMQLDMALFDFDAYAALYKESRKMLQAEAASGAGAAKAARLPVDVGDDQPQGEDQQSAGAAPPAASAPLVRAEPAIDGTIAPTQPTTTSTELPFPSSDLASKQAALVAAWPGFAELRRLKPREYDAALIKVPAATGVVDVNNAIPIMTSAVVQIVKSNLGQLTRADDRDVIVLLKSQIDVYQTIERNFGEEFCGRMTLNQLGQYAQPDFLQPHLLSLINVLKSVLGLQLKLMDAQERYANEPLRAGQNSVALIPLVPDIMVLQNAKAAQQYDKVCPALKSVLNKAIASTDGMAQDARLAILLSTQQ